MSAILKIVCLAIVQGTTELLPISSSGHLVLAEHFLRVQSPGVILEVGLHMGTLLAVLVFYRQKIADIVLGCVRRDAAALRYAAAIVLGTIPAGIVGIGMKDHLERVFDSPRTVSAMLCLTGLIVISLRWVRARSRDTSPAAGFWIGVAQAVAIIPGVSRSGSTIALARHIGLAPEAAAEFSFLLSIPALLGASLIAGADAVQGGLGGLAVTDVLIGMAVAAVVGFLALRWLVRLLSAGRFWLFGIYALAVGICGLLFIR